MLFGGLWELWRVGAQELLREFDRSNLQALLGCFWEGFVGSGVCSFSGQGRRFGSNLRVQGLQVLSFVFSGFVIAGFAGIIGSVHPWVGVLNPAR